MLIPPRCPSAQAACLAADTGPPAEVERWADIVDRWQFGGGTRPNDPVAEAGIVVPVATLLHGIARILCGDLDGGDALLEETLSDRQEIAAPWSVRS